MAATASAKANLEPTRLHRWTNLNWAHKDFPLFSLYGPFDHKPGRSAILREKNALHVHDFREVILANDDRGITIWLNEQDTRRLKTLAQKNEGRWFVVVAPPKEFSAGPSSVAVVSTTAAMAGGHITFKHPESAAIAQNLRRRFRIAEFRLTPW